MEPRRLAFKRMVKRYHRVRFNRVMNDQIWGDRHPTSDEGDLDKGRWKIVIESEETR
jgi:hypothetical protein